MRTPLLLGALATPALPAATFLTPVRAFMPRLAGHGAPDHVALTFDDGPDPRSTPHFLEVLRRRGIHATFFLIGEQLSRNPYLGKEIAAAGHEVAVHGWRHQCVLGRGRVYDDLARTHDLIARITGVRPRWYRPPYGVLSWPALLAARLLDLTPVLWSSWGRDWTANATPASVFRTVTRDLHGGGTVLLHDSDRYAAVDSWRSALGALPLLLDECSRRQFGIGPLRDHKITV
jgi:peptidoglycan-N-acetylglucosamine deacetylase